MMAEYASVWLSNYVVLTACLAPAVLIHRTAVSRALFLPGSIWVQRIVAFSFLIVPTVLALPPLSEPSSEHSKAVAADFLAAVPATASAHMKPAADAGLPDFFFIILNAIFLSVVAGLIFFGVRLLGQELSLQKLQRRSERTKVGTKLVLYRSDQIKVPFSVGVLRKRIFLPLGLKDPEMTIIRQHEAAHCALNHHLWSLIEAFQTHVFWFNPLTHWLRSTGYALREMETDEYSVREIAKLDYARTLLKTAEMFAAQRFLPIRGQGWGYQGGLRMRLDHLLRPKQIKGLSAWLGVYLFVVIFGLASTLYFAVRVDGATEAAFLETIRSQYSDITRTRQLTDINKVPTHFIKALLTHEDQGYFDHQGFSGSAMIRAVGRNLNSWLIGGPAFVSGGSTITQQLAKQFLPAEPRSLKRKFREIKVARTLEKHFSKDEILAMYLNSVYFGNQAWGLAQASQTYFQCDYDRLSEEQSAMLVPFLEAPAKYNSLVDPARAKERQARLLARMRSQ